MYVNDKIRNCKSLEILMFIKAIVKCVCISLLVPLFTYATEPNYYQIDLLVYTQPQSDPFGSIQIDKYKQLLEQTLTTPIEQTHIQPYTQLSPAMQETMRKLEAQSITYQWQSWIIRFDAQEKHLLPITLTLPKNKLFAPTTPLTDYIVVHGQLILQNQLYLDLHSKLAIEQYESSYLKKFDYSQHTRHLKINKTQYLDNNFIGILIRVNRSSADKMATAALMQTFIPAESTHHEHHAPVIISPLVFNQDPENINSTSITPEQKILTPHSNSFMDNTHEQSLYSRPQDSPIHIQPTTDE